MSPEQLRLDQPSHTYEPTGRDRYCARCGWLNTALIHTANLVRTRVVLSIDHDRQVGGTEVAEVLLKALAADRVMVLADLHVLP